MIKDKCKHEWRQFSNSQGTVRGEATAKFQCVKCTVWLSASEVFQLEALENQTKTLENQTKLAEHQLGFQKWISILAFIISMAAVITVGLK